MAVKVLDDQTRKLMKDSVMRVRKNRSKGGFTVTDVRDDMLRRHQVDPGPAAVSALLQKMHNSEMLIKATTKRACTRDTSKGRKLVVWQKP